MVGMAEAVEGSAWGFNQLDFNELLASVHDFDDKKELSKANNLERFGLALSE